MQEPNLDYINNLANGDDKFKDKLITVLKEEFPKEMNTLKENLNNRNLQKTANNIHKIKYKLSLLGLEEDFETASKFENEIKESNLELQVNFEQILEKINLFLTKI